MYYTSHFHAVSKTNSKFSCRTGVYEVKKFFVMFQCRISNLRFVFGVNHSGVSVLVSENKWTAKYFHVLLTVIIRSDNTLMLSNLCLLVTMDIVDIVEQYN